jgi:hypothetical protein
MLTKARLKELALRLTGIGSPWVSAQWNPPPAQRAVAKRVIALLEDKRVLYANYAWEEPRHCALSVLDIREALTQELGNLEPGIEIADTLRALRAACRKFLTAMGSEDGAGRPRYRDDRDFLTALGEFRAVVGVHTAIIAAKFGVPVEGELASTLPLADDPNEKFPLNDLRRQLGR